VAILSRPTQGGDITFYGQAAESIILRIISPAYSRHIKAVSCMEKATKITSKYQMLVLTRIAATAVFDKSLNYRLLMNNSVVNYILPTRLL